jgi:hypothetical protein
MKYVRLCSSDFLIVHEVGEIYLEIECMMDLFAGQNFYVTDYFLASFFAMLCKPAHCARPVLSMQGMGTPKEMHQLFRKKAKWKKLHQTQLLRVLTILSFVLSDCRTTGCMPGLPDGIF